MRLSRSVRTPGLSTLPPPFALRFPVPFPALALATLALAVGASGCAHLPWRHAHVVPVVNTGTPVAHSETLPPADTTAVADTSAAKPVPVPKPAKTEKKEEPREEKSDTPPATNPPTPVESVMSPAEAKQARESAVADSTAAGQALRKCSGRALLPDQESVYDTVRSLIAQTRAALVGGELWRAQSLARKARQLSSSLSCP